ncbi:sel1 repeat family protein [Aestuariibacter salexigens]|uniref:sel1 repeat family protein n=1 Tax=Aestuariibacter salexigens TaxID=226010 RepID=UPI000554348C|nr:sel1 repeat family protein [Aestuariibacter salexigens]
MSTFHRSSGLRQRGFVASNWLLLIIVALIVAAWVYVGTQGSRDEENRDTTNNNEQLEQSLSVCNELVDAAPSEALEACSALAEEGSYRAQQKMAFLYSVEGDYQDWQAAFDYLALASRQRDESKLLSNILLFILGTEPQDQESGEQGIRELANVGYPMALAYLASIYQLELNSMPKQASPAWLMERAYETDNTIVSAYDMARIHSNGYGTRVNMKRAANILDDYAMTNFPTTTNNVAWFLATLDENPITDPTYPLQLAKKVVDDEEHAERYSYVDTLAAAYANNGEFAQALSLQQQAIDFLEADEQLTDTRKQELRSEFDERLALYQQQQRPVYFNLYQPQQAFYKKLKAAIENALLDRHEAATRMTAN